MKSPPQVKQQQAEIFQFLDSKNIKYFAKDITQSSALKDEMRKKVGNPTAMPPQVFNGNNYCGVSFFKHIMACPCTCPCLMIIMHHHGVIKEKTQPKIHQF